MGQSIVLSVFVEIASRLLEVKSDADFPTLTPYVQNPFVVAGASVQPRLAAHRDAFDTSQLAVEVYGFKHRFDNDLIRSMSTLFRRIVPGGGFSQ